MRPRHTPLQRFWEELHRSRQMPAPLSSGVPGHTLEQQAFLRQMAQAWQQPSTDLTLTDLEVVVFDLETTGFHPHRGDVILSIGAVAMRGAERFAEETFACLVDPGRPIPPSIQQLTGLTPDLLSQAPSLPDALTRFFRFVGNRPLVAHHSGHERAFLQAALWKTSRRRLTHRLLDTLLLIRLCDGPLRETSLDALCARHGIAIPKRHDALCDAWAAAELWGTYLQKALERGFHTLHEVYRELGSR